uniref:Uncharacterized protein n=1 Tax=Oryza glumipatula TaxID=40148 RepID=A0A0E0B4K1_9ORYZ
MLRWFCESRRRRRRRHAVQHGLRRLRHGGAARVVDVGGREHDGRRARLAPVPAHVAAERLPHGELDPAHAAHSWMRALSLSAAAAAGSLSSFACSRVWLVRWPSPWSDGNDLLHVLHSNTPSAASALLPAGVDDDVGAIDVATRVTTVRAARWRAPGDEQPRRGDAERLRVMSSLVAWELAAEDEDDADAARESEVAARLARLLRRSPRRPTPWRPPARGRFAAGCDTAP